MVIDAHCHVYPPKIAARAAASIGAFYDAPMYGDGTAEMLLSEMDEAGIDCALISSCATSPQQVGPINAFLAKTAAESRGRLIALGTMHPDSAALEVDFENLCSLGLHGIKMHHDFQEIAIDDPRCFPIYELAAGRMPILFHTGDYRYEFTNPAQLIPVLRAFPKLQVVAAHLGGYTVWHEAARAVSGFDNLVVDCSSSLGLLPDAETKLLIRTYGADRVLFGTDFPMWKPASELAHFRALGFSPEEERVILSENARRVFGI